jgi:hypothetical protein
MVAIGPHLRITAARDGIIAFEEFRPVVQENRDPAVSPD